MIRRTFYFLLVTVLLGGLAGVIAFWSFYALPAMIAQSIQSAPASGSDGFRRGGQIRKLAA